MEQAQGSSWNQARRFAGSERLDARRRPQPYAQLPPLPEHTADHPTRTDGTPGPPSAGESPTPSRLLPAVPRCMAAACWRPSMTAAIYAR